MHQSRKMAGLVLVVVSLLGSLFGCATKSPSSQTTEQTTNAAESHTTSTTGIVDTASTTGIDTTNTAESTEAAFTTTEGINMGTQSNRTVTTTTQTDAPTSALSTSRTRASTKITATATTTARVSWNGPKDYTIVIPAAADEHIQAAAQKLQSYFKEKSQVVLPIVTDDQKETSKEILVGKTNRSASDQNIADNAYSVTVKGEKLVVEGGHYLSVEKAVYLFTKTDQNNNGICELGGTSDLELTKLGKYQYVWGDEFDADALDPAKWELGDNMSGDAYLTLSDDPSILRVEDGMLRMNARRWFDPSNNLIQYATTYSVRTKHAMSFQYGYLEMRARVPYKRGAWPSFWMVSNGAIGQRPDAKCFAEVDILEVYASTNEAVPNIHKWFYNGPHTAYQTDTDLNKSYKFTNTDALSDEFHIYGFEWTDKEMSMYIDGEKYMTYDLTYDYDGNGDMEAFHDPMYIIINNHLFSPDTYWHPYEGSEVLPTDLPMQYDVDWIRLYQQPGVGALNFAE